MGFAKDIQIEAEDRGWYSLDGNVCDECVGEDFLAQYVRDNAISNKCDYCGRVEPANIAADADDVMSLIGAGLYQEWTHPVQVMGRVDGEWVGTTFELSDVLWEADLDPSDRFREAIESAFLDDLWCEFDPYGLEQHKILAHGWKRFSDHVKHHTRYVFLLEKDTSKYPDREEIHPGQMLQRLEDVVREAEIIDLVPRGTHFARARSHAANTDPKSASALGTPPQDRAIRSNRMSPAGIPMFYGASDRETAKAELTHSRDPLVTLGEFMTLRDMRLANLSKIPAVPSLFDEVRAWKRPNLLFLQNFADDISKPVFGDDREHIEYVPTQIVTDFFRRVFRDATEASLDGLLYRSSQREAGECCVLFVENSQCVDSGNEDPHALLMLDNSSVRTEPTSRS